jgi:hypothetical protein
MRPAPQKRGSTAVEVAAGFGGSPERPRMRLVSWKPMAKGNLSRLRNHRVAERPDDP